MTQENVIAGENNKKNDKDNIRSKPSPGVGRRAVSEKHELFIIMQKREKYATSFSLALSNPQPPSLPRPIQPPVTRLENKICFDSARVKENMSFAESHLKL